MKNYLEEFVKGINLSDVIQIAPKYGEPLGKNEIKETLKKLPHIPQDSLIVVNDTDRSTPTRKIITILRELNLLQHPVTFIIATGTHAPIPDELARKISGAQKEDTVVVHNCYHEDDHTFLGTTSRNTRVSLDKHVLNAPFILTINSVEPHYFAGFTGGIKSLVPGLASRETVEMNHRWAITPESSIMKTRDNPLYEDLIEAGKLLPNFASIQTIQVVNHEENLYSLHTGSLSNTFEKAKKVATEIYSHKLENKVDCIISFVQSPLDKSLYQSQKAMENTKNVLKAGGTFILVAECYEGIGNPKFFQRLHSLETPENALTSLSFPKYQFGDHKAYYWAELASRATLFYCGDLLKKIVSTAFMRKIDMEELISLHKSMKKEGKSILVDKNGGFSVAYL